MEGGDFVVDEWNEIKEEEREHHEI